MRKKWIPYSEFMRRVQGLRKEWHPKTDGTVKDKEEEEYEEDQKEGPPFTDIEEGMDEEKGE